MSRNTLIALSVIIVSAVVFTLVGRTLTRNSTRSAARASFNSSDAHEAGETAGSDASQGDYRGEKIVKTEAEWRAQLTAEQYRVMRDKGTERAYTGVYNDHHESGTYHCAACDLALFNSKAKFESGTGWPSFFQPIAAANVTEEVDSAFGKQRTEVLCSRCGAHLGHVFDDGPKPSGLRYCMNSVSLKFKKQS